MKRLGIIAAIAILVVPAGTPGEPDSFGVGQGTVPLLVTSGSAISVNSYTQVTGPLLPGDTSIPVSSTPDFSSGNLVMVLQTTGIVPEPNSGQPGPFDISNDPVGRWEFARLASGTTTTRLQLTAPLINSYATNVTQVIRVPEYQSVTIMPGASIVSSPWNGSTGGVVAFLVQGNVDNAGQINANGAIPVGSGFRGGQAIRDARPRDAGVCSAAALDLGPAAGGQKGEGVASTRYVASASGRGNVANGAGGGNCFNAGGGGGGNGGPGGNGGFSWFGENVGGMGGGALSFSALTRLALGGGGGAGHQTVAASNGGRGGGIVFIRGGAMIGSGGIVTANGQSASDAGIDDGAGGGGAGGTIYLRFVGDVACNSVTANGGDGGSTAGDGGPGGGGGGGRVLIQGNNVSGCPVLVLSGIAGSQPDGGRYGATPPTSDGGSIGRVEVLSGGFRLLRPPTIVTPADGSSTSNRRPMISGSADSNVTVILFLDGSELARIPSSTGSFSFPPVADLPLGPHRVQAASEFQAVRSPLSSANNFTILAPDAGTPDGGDAGVPDGGDAGIPDGGTGPEFTGGGCTCGSAGGGVVLPALLFALALIRRRNARQAG